MTQPEPADDDLVTITEIADITGKARPTVSNWKRRHNDFPSPAGRGAKGPLFRRTEVLAWLTRHDKIPEPRTAVRDATNASDIDQRWWELVESARGWMTAADLLHTVLGVLAGRPPTSTGSLLDRLPGELHTLRAAMEPAQRVALSTELIDRAAKWDTTGTCQPTPASVAALIAQLLGPAERVYDPASGLGTLLAAAAAGAAASGEPPELFGQETNDTTADTSRSYLELLDTTADIRTGDAIRQDRFADQRFPGIVTAPTFGQRLEANVISAADPRWAYGTPSRNADEAWLQHVVYHLSPGGRAVMQLRSAFLSATGSTAQLRASLVRAGIIRAVVQLPSGTVAGSAVPSVLVVLERPQQLVMAPQILIGEPALEPPTRHDWSTADIDAVRDVVHSWLNDPAAADLPAGYAAVGIDDLAAADFDLSPRRLLVGETHETRPVSQIRADLDRSITAARTAARTLLDNLDALLAAVPSDTTPATRVTLGSIPSVEVTRGMKPQRLADTGEIPVHNPHNIATGEPPTEFLPATSEELSTPAPSFNVRAGDVLLVVDGPIGAVHVATEPMFVSSHFVVIRCAGSDLDGRYLACWLAGVEAQQHLRRLTTGTTLRRVSLKDVRSLPVPTPPRDLQRSIGDLYDEVQQLNAINDAISTSVVEIEELSTEAVVSTLPAPSQPVNGS